MKAIMIIGVLLVIALSILHPHATSSSVLSPYAGQETRAIKALSPADMQGLMAGEGTPFDGMAKAAELNGYPGPRHVLDAADELGLDAEQKAKVEALYEEMHDAAVPLGQQIIAKETQIDNAFKDWTVKEATLEQMVTESATLYGQLRFVHLRAHLAMMDILTPEQVEKYKELRGYTSDEDPCLSVPEGHDPVMWMAHHGCA